ncbi:N-acyl-L-amino acid amidohydrolase (EC [Olavius sp. associated proteobacterium Delta 1]|nr:N-acyl-L-amino acid amidohydrolase (EC [Olavius sp. associated proteobacterium Delta 1]
MVDIHKLVKEHKELVVNTRRDLHRIPEVGYTEEKTSAYVADYLTREGLEVQSGIARFGVVGLLNTGKSGPTLMVRADMDALPLQEETGLEFASTHDGVMHACGHDAHMAMGLAAATVLNKIKDELTGTVKFIFQPAEEGPGGAEPMIKAGVMENPKVDYAIGCHVWPEIPEGTIGVRSGPFLAAMDRYDLKIIGRGGHGAMPHMCVDALEVGTQVVSALQRISSRHMSPIEPVVVTVGSFHAGTAFNIIPGEAVLSGTTRTFDLDIWHSWEKRLEKVIRGVCESMGAEYEFKFSKGYPPTINDDAMSDLVRRCAAEVVGTDKVVEPAKTMGGEDMSFFLQKAKGCFFGLGAGQSDRVGVHNPQFTFNEDILPLGVETHCRFAMELLS